MSKISAQSEQLWALVVKGIVKKSDYREFHKIFKTFLTGYCTVAKCVMFSAKTIKGEMKTKNKTKMITEKDKKNIKNCLKKL